LVQSSRKDIYEARLPVALDELKNVTIHSMTAQKTSIAYIIIFIIQV